MEANQALGLVHLSYHDFLVVFINSDQIQSGGDELVLSQDTDIKRLIINPLVKRCGINLTL
jgi:hypothetical protein